MDLKKIIPDFRPSMRFLINRGIAFEGTIGSLYKIDASYLGEDICFTQSLFNAVKIYGCPIVLTEMMYEQLSKKFQSLVR